MKAFLVRVGIDSIFGEWNAPIDPVSGEFVFVPIPEREKIRPGLERSYRELTPVLESFFEKHATKTNNELVKFKQKLIHRPMHLDPDFEYLTYGDCEVLDNGKMKVRGVSLISKVEPRDLIVFYAGLRSVRHPYQLIYSLIGLFKIKEKVVADLVPSNRFKENAHTRRVPRRKDFIFRADTESSGRLERCIPMGGFEKGAYRIKEEIHQAWGGVKVKDRFIQRGSPFEFNDAERFWNWLQEIKIPLLRRNN